MGVLRAVGAHGRTGGRTKKTKDRKHDGRACAAAARALHFDCITYGSIKNILRRALDLEPLPDGTPARQWAQGSRFARTPHAILFSSRKENDPCQSATISSPSSRSSASQAS